MSDGDPNRFPRRRYALLRARVVHKQFLLLEDDVAEAERRCSDLLEKSRIAFRQMSKIVEREMEGESDPAGKVLEELAKLRTVRKMTTSHKPHDSAD